MARPTPNDFAATVNGHRAARWYWAGTLLLGAFFAAVVLGFTAAGALVTWRGGGVDTTVAWLLAASGVLAVACALCGGLALARAGRLDDAAAAPMQTAVAADLWHTYRLRVPPSQIPTEPGCTTLVLAEVDGLTVPVAVVFPTGDSPIELARTSVSAA